MAANLKELKNSWRTQYKNMTNIIHFLFWNHRVDALSCDQPKRVCQEAEGTDEEVDAGDNDQKSDGGLTKEK